MPENDTPWALANLEETASELNAASDRLNAAIEAIQKRLVESGIGIEFWISMEHTREWDQEAENVGWRVWDEHQLGYARYGDGWSLLTRTARFEDTDSEEEWTYGEVKPLVRSPRQIRLFAVTSLPALINQLEREAQRLLSLVGEAEQLAYTGSTPVVPSDDRLQVRCLVSGRYLQFGPTSSLIGAGEALSVDLMTVNGKSQAPQKLGFVIITREDLQQVLGRIAPKSEQGEDVLGDSEDKQR